MNFMNLPKEYTENAYFHIISIPQEKNVTFGKGAKNGPKKIISASHQLEYYDEQFDCEPFLKHIDTITLKPKRIEEMNIELKGFTIILGGDHSTTLAINKKDADVIVLDAHSDLRHSWNGSQYNHACVSKQLSKTRSVGIIGVRSQDIDEVREQPKNVHIIKSYEFSIKKLEELLKKLKKEIYLSIDVDFFDPSFIRSTGTPEPGGFFWNETINILIKIFKEKKVIGVDIVEFTGKNKSESYHIAKLVYKLMGLHLTYK